MPLMPFVIILLSLVIVLSACRFQVYHPERYKVDALISPYGMSTASYEDLPHLDQAFVIIDQQIFNLVGLYLNLDGRTNNNLIVVDDSTILENVISYPQDLANLRFKAITDVYCVSGQCQGVKMSGFADVDINLETLSIHVKNLNASTPDQNIIISGSIERVLPHKLLQNMANADLVLTINDTNVIMDPEAQMLFYQNLARDGILEAIFSAKNEGLSITLYGNLNSH